MFSPQGRYMWVQAWNNWDHSDKFSILYFSFRLWRPWWRLSLQRRRLRKRWLQLVWPQTCGHQHGCLPGCDMPFCGWEHQAQLCAIGSARVPPITHTAQNIACVKASLMEEWGITNKKVTCMVTDGAPNMVACMRAEASAPYMHCTHALVMKKALDQNPVLSAIRAKARKLVGFFRSSTTAKVWSFHFIIMYNTNILSVFLLQLF